MRSHQLALLLAALLVASPVAAQPLAPVGAGDDPRVVVVRAVAVAQTPQGHVGTVANVSISQAPGTGLLFMDTQPFTQVDIQGSARLAVRVAGAVTGLDVGARDFFFVVRSGSQVIGGPSAGAVMTVGAVAALQGWSIDPGVLMTGTVNPDGSIGPVGGIPEKARAAAAQGAHLFLYPEGEEQAVGVGPQGRYVVNMSRYCPEQLGIECRPVAHVDEAIEAFTGHRFERPPLEADASRFLDVMGPLAGAALEDAAARVQEARDRLAAANLPQGATRAELERRVGEARLALLDGQEARAVGRPYTAASRAFVAAIEARHVASVLDHLEAPEARQHLLDVLEETDAAVARAARAATSVVPRGLSELEAVGAAQVRVADAERAAASARAMAETGNVAGALREAAFAHERAQTVTWWLDIGAQFAEGDPVPPADLAREAAQILDETRQLVAYVQGTLAGGGYGPAPLDEAQTRLARAEADLARSRPAAALFQALEAQVRAGLALESVAFGEHVPPARLARAEGDAARAIAEARARGIEPILAASTAEFAQTLPPGPDRLATLSMARLVARSHDYFLAVEGDDPVPSRYVGVPGTRAASRAVDPAAGPLAEGAALALLAVLVPLAAAAGAAAARRRQTRIVLEPLPPTPARPTVVETPRPPPEAPR